MAITRPAPVIASGTTAGLSGSLQAIAANTDYLHDAAEAHNYYNNSASTVATGALMVQDTGDNKLTPATSAGQAGPFWVCKSATVPAGTQGDFASSGYATLQYTGTAPQEKQRLQASATAGKAQVGTANSFATAMADGASGVVVVLLDGPTGGVAAALPAHASTHNAGGSDALATVPAHLHQGTAGDGGKLTSPRIVTDLSDTNGNELFKVTATASAVNEFTVANAATGNAPTRTASGGDTNVGITDATKGTGAYTVQTNGATRLTVDGNGNHIPGTAALATNATDGFLYASSSAGPPTGTPTTATGRVPYHFDTTNGRLYAYIGGAWVYVPVGSQTANQVYAGPTSGGAAQPAFRALVIADLPVITQSDIATGSTAGPTTTSTSYVDLTNMSVTLTTVAADLLVWFSGSFLMNVTGSFVNVALSLDGAAEVAIRTFAPPSANQALPISMSHKFAGVSAGSHTVKARWLVGANTATAYDTQRSLLVLEVRR